MAQPRVIVSGSVIAREPAPRSPDAPATTAPPSPQPRKHSGQSNSAPETATTTAATSSPSTSSKRQVARQRAATQADNAAHGLMTLMEIEREARDAPTLDDLRDVIANQTPKLTAARQTFVFEARAWSGANARARMKLVAITGISNVDRTVPTVHTFERIADKLAARVDLNKAPVEPYTCTTSEFPKERDDLANSYPFHELCWVPFLSRRNELIGGILLTRERAWTPSDGVVCTRVSGAYQHAWGHLIATPRRARADNSKRVLLSLALLAVFLCLAIPVPMSTLAPMEVVPSDPFIVAAPIPGVVDKIAVDPNAPVATGELLIAFDNTTLHNRLELAEREVLVATARLKRVTQLAFSDIKGRHELGIARAEMSLKTAERDYARDMLSQSRIIAPRDGIAIFADKNELVGKPLAVGERIMQIANPDKVEVRIDVPLGDVLILDVGAPVTLYLDIDPLQPVAATVTKADFEAKKTAADQLAYKVIAKLDDNDAPPPRLGVRGTAQIFGDSVSLGFFLFRKPISAMRQWLGL